MMLDTGQGGQQVPRHEFRVVEEDGREKVEITVQLPGVASASELSVRINPPQTVIVQVPGRYHLELRLAMPIASRADMVKFRPKAAKLLMSCRVLMPDELAALAQQVAAQKDAATPATATGLTAGGSSLGSSTDGSGSSAAPAQVAGPRALSVSTGSDDSSQRPKTPQKQQQLKQRQQQRRLQQQQQQQQQRTVHESFFPQPTKAERKKQEEEEQRRLQEEQAAAAALAAEAAAQAESLRQEQEAAAAEAARREREEARAAARAARKAEAAAAKAAAAAEEAQRREQLRLEKQAAAQEWLRRGHSAAAEGDVELAAKALNKASELDPTNTQGILRLAKEVNSLKQQAAAAAAAANGSSSGFRTPGPGSTPQAGRPPPMKKLRPSWELSMRQDVPGLLSAYAAGEHERNAVGWWCALVSFVCYWVTWLGAAAASGFAGASALLQRVPLSGPVQLCCGMAERMATCIKLLPLALLVTWRKAWVIPVKVAAFMRGVGGDKEEKVSAWLAKRINHLQHTEAVVPAVIKLALAAASAAAVWGTVLCVCSVEFGEHTLLGWLWTLGIWEPQNTLQMLVAGVSSVACFGGHVGACTVTIYPLQILLTAGGRFGIVSIVLSLLVQLCLHMWRTKIWCRRQQSTTFSQQGPWWKAAPPWQAVLIAVLPAQLLRLLVRTDTWFKFARAVTDTGLYIYDAWQAYGHDAVVSVGAFLQTLLAFVLAIFTVGPLGFLGAPLDAVLSTVSSGSFLTNHSTAAVSDWWLDIWPTILYAALFVSLPLLSPSYKLRMVTHCLYDGYDSDICGGCGDLETADQCDVLLRVYRDSIAARDTIPHSWQLDLLLIAWVVLVFIALRVWNKEIQQGRNPGQYWQRRRQGWRSRGASRGAGARYDASESDSDDQDVLAEHEFPMGFRAVPVPRGCEVATVRTVLQAADYYQVMGYVRRGDVSSESLKTKRRQLVLAVHPDKVGDQHPGANLAASRVNKAFETLSDPSKRDTYDDYLDAQGSSKAKQQQRQKASSSGGGGSSSTAARGRKRGKHR